MKAKIFIGPEFSGKTRTAKLIAEYIGLKKTVFIQGRLFKMNTDFIFRDINSFTELVVIDDVPEDFSFEIFYDIEYKSKNKNEILGFNFNCKKPGYFPEKHCVPNLIITTNFKPKTKGKSFDRRFELIEFPVCDLSKIKTEE